MSPAAPDILDASGLRVLVVHNRYRSDQPSGENTAVDSDVGLLRRLGAEVHTHLRSSDEIDGMPWAQRLTLPARPLHSPADTGAVADLIARYRPHVVHLHNPYPLISPSVIRTARRRGVPVVHTVHNYRHSCLNGLHIRDGVVCTDCRGRDLPLPAIRHGCYRDSRAQSLVLGLTEWRHRSTWAAVDRVLVLNRFMAEAVALSGIPADHIRTRQNFVEDPGPTSPPGTDVVFVGRLERAKGTDALRAAWDQHRRRDGRLVIVGDGPERATLDAWARTRDDVTVTGPLPRAGLTEVYRRAAAVVLPSMWFEGTPLVLLEAFAHGRPVIAHAVGSLAELVDDTIGWSVPPKPIDLAAAIDDAIGDPTEAGRRGSAARHRYEERHTTAASGATLLGTYHEIADWTAP